MGRQSVFEGENYKVLINHSIKGHKLRSLILPERYKETGSVEGFIGRYDLRKFILRSYRTKKGKLNCAGASGEIDDGEHLIQGDFKRKFEGELTDILDGTVSLSSHEYKISVSLDPLEQEIESLFSGLNSSDTYISSEKIRSKMADFARIGLIVVNFDLKNKKVAERLLEYFANYAKNYK